MSRKQFGGGSLGKDTFKLLLCLTLARYPLAAQDHLHKTKANVPLDIAKALSVNPSLVQKVVEAFYTRDAAQLRVRFSLRSVKLRFNFQGRAQNDALPSTYICSSSCKDDTNVLRSARGPEIPPAENIWSMERRRGLQGLEMEGYWHEDCSVVP